MNRGHLVGYQFSGLNDEGRNLVPMTAWLNTGAFTGTDDKNQSSMLYYENGLDSWLANHPNYYLDYKVTAVYKDNELIPRQIILQYVGIDQDGKLLEIKLGSSKEKIDKYSVTHVALDNVSENAEINYADGTAKNTVKSAEERAAELKAAEEKAKKEAEEKKHKKKLKKRQKKRIKKNRHSRKLKHQQKNHKVVIQVVTLEIEKEDGTDQMGNMPLKRKSEKLVCSGNLLKLKKS